MNAHHLRIGQLVSPCDPDALADRCLAYTLRSRHGIIAAITEDQAAVTWIDYRGLAHDTCLVPAPLLCTATLDSAARTRVIPCRSPDTAMTGLSPMTLPPNAAPTIEMRELRITSSRSSETATGLTFHTARDANVALHALADAQDAFQSTFGPDPASAVPGADTVVVYRAFYTTVYRPDHRAASHSPTPAALAG